MPFTKTSATISPIGEVTLHTDTSEHTILIACDWEEAEIESRVGEQGYIGKGSYKIGIMVTDLVISVSILLTNHSGTLQ